MSKPLKWSIPGIRAIYAIDPDIIPIGIELRAESDRPQLIAGDDTTVTEIEFSDTPTCEITETHTKNGVTYESVLKFIAPAADFHPRSAWIVIDNHGRQTLFGVNGNPVPRVTTKTTTGTFATRAGVSVEIKCITPPAEVLLLY
ncbi:MAG: hypothetical protein K2I48_00195 [Muribaculaceae bacterium]|nr:hypothetical protein [Muribaculaceae bacterium]